ncbi:MAG: DnaJ domain-containing protein [Synechococcaceae cyanobacterium]|nr:DnaJ domain-containing protein [Synechococcaceae cyanobacterium]
MPSSPDGSCYYALLQLSPSAGTQELRQAFRRLSKRYHPDTTLLPAAQAEQAFQQLQQAYAVLSDPDSRRAYDSQRLALRQLQAARPVSARPSPGPGTSRERPVSVRRALSGGEWFALLLLAVALVLSMVLGIGVAWARGAAFIRQPSWWAEASAAGPPTSSAAEAVPPGPAAASPNAWRPPPPSASGAPLIGGSLAPPAASMPARAMDAGPAAGPPASAPAPLPSIAVPPLPR